MAVFHIIHCVERCWGRGFLVFKGVGEFLVEGGGEGEFLSFIEIIANISTFRPGENHPKYLSTKFPIISHLSTFVIVGTVGGKRCQKKMFM